MVKSFTLLATLGSPFAIANDFSLIAEVASESVVRGISQSPDDPIAKLMFEWDNPNGLFAGTLFYSSSKSPSPFRTRGLSVHGGWFHLLAEDQALEISLSKHHFPGDFVRSWDYQEIQVDYHLTRSFSFTLNYSDDYYGRGTASHFIGANWQHLINDDLYLFTNVGIRTFTDSIYSENIENASLGMGYALDNHWDVRLSIEYANEEIEFFHGEDTAGSRLLASISYLIF